VIRHDILRDATTPVICQAARNIYERLEIPAYSLARIVDLLTKSSARNQRKKTVPFSRVAGSKISLAIFFNKTVC